MSGTEAGPAGGARHVADDVAQLRSPAAVRTRSRRVADAVEAGRSEHFRLDRSRLPKVADRIAALTLQRFPDLRVPYHSRWRHFEAGGVDRRAELDRRLDGRSPTAIARARIDLTLVSVLLDAGAGAEWRYADADGREYRRSEGLAVASFRAFMAGTFSSDAGDPYRVDAVALKRLDAAALARAFQAGDANPIVGLEGRARLMRSLGDALLERPAWFTSIGQPGHLYDVLVHRGPATPLHGRIVAPTQNRHVAAARILGVLLDAFSAIWPSGQRLADGTPLGDAWPHRFAGDDGGPGWVPFHKLSQWLTYSLLEPFEWAGVQVTGIDDLTALPEYRNGGLLLDAGVLVPLDAEFPARAYEPVDEWVIEWRALTVALLDDLLPMVRERLQAPALPLACLLEGGSWLAGRQIAAEKRPGGSPPVRVDSDGTVF